MSPRQALASLPPIPVNVATITLAITFVGGTLSIVWCGSTWAARIESKVESGNAAAAEWREQFADHESRIRALERERPVRTLATSRPPSANP